MATNFILFALAAFFCCKDFLSSRKIASMRQALQYAKISFETCEDYAHPEKDGAEILKICQRAIGMITPVMGDIGPPPNVTGGVFPETKAA